MPRRSRRPVRLRERELDPLTERVTLVLQQLPRCGAVPGARCSVYVCRPLAGQQVLEDDQGPQIVSHLRLRKFGSQQTVSVGLVRLPRTPDARDVVLRAVRSRRRTADRATIFGSAPVGRSEASGQPLASRACSRRRARPVRLEPRQMNEYGSVKVSVARSARPRTHASSSSRTSRRRSPSCRCAGPDRGSRRGRCRVSWIVASGSSGRRRASTRPPETPTSAASGRRSTSPAREEALHLAPVERHEVARVERPAAPRRSARAPPAAASSRSGRRRGTPGSRPQRRPAARAARAGAVATCASYRRRAATNCSAISVLNGSSLASSAS